MAARKTNLPVRRTRLLQRGQAQTGKKKERVSAAGHVVELRIPGLPEFVSVARLTLSGIASRMDFPYESIEDMKVALAEACNNAIQHAYRNGETEEEAVSADRQVVVRFTLAQKKLVMEVEDRGCGFDSGKEIKPPDMTREGGLGLFLIRSLMDELHLQSTGKKGTRVVMVKYK